MRTRQNDTRNEQTLMQINIHSTNHSHRSGAMRRWHEQKIRNLSWYFSRVYSTRFLVLVQVWRPRYDCKDACANSAFLLHPVVYI